MRFVKGESGNPAWRPPDARNTATLLCEALIDAEGENLTRQVIARAHDGDAVSLRLCLGRVLPHGSDRPVPPSSSHPATDVLRGGVRNNEAMKTMENNEQRKQWKYNETGPPGGAAGRACERSCAGAPGIG